MSQLPKVELHLHLEGAAPPAFIRGLAKEKSIDLSGAFRPDGSYDTGDFWHFLKVYEAACTTLQSPEDFRRLTLAVLEESASSGVVYTEAFLSPDFCGGRDLTASSRRSGISARKRRARRRSARRKRRGGS